MNKEQLTDWLYRAVDDLRLAVDPALPECSWEVVAASFERSRNLQFGDWSTPLALRLAKSWKQKPRTLAERLKQQLVDGVQPSPLVRVTVDGPGFLNLLLPLSQRLEGLKDPVAQQSRSLPWGHVMMGEKAPILLEMVSANPTGPLHVGHGRHAVYGDVLARLLIASGQRVHREYYLNDAGRQIDILVLSTLLAFQFGGADEPPWLPANRYRGDYVQEIARELSTDLCDALASLQPTFVERIQGAAIPARQNEPSAAMDANERKVSEEQHLDQCLGIMAQCVPPEVQSRLKKEVVQVVLSQIRQTLERLDVQIDCWSSEQELHDAGKVEECLSHLEQTDATKRDNGALWLLSQRHGDDKDRVLKRSDQRATYLAADLAYHADKLNRGYCQLINVWGHDHHGYVKRLEIGTQALAGSAKDLAMEIHLMQLVKLHRQGKEVRMSTRAGSFETLDQLLDDVGGDVARLFYLLAPNETPIEFDLDLAIEQSQDNPLYYLQYAHARCCSIVRKVAETYGGDATDTLSWLERQEWSQPPDSTSEMEAEELQATRQLLMQVEDWPEVIQQSASQRHPHEIVYALRRLAASFHHFYGVARVLEDDAHVRHRRLALVVATRSTLASGLAILGVEAPQSMEREEAS